MIVISTDLVLSETPELNPDNPVIGWDNLVTTSNIVADTEDADYPASNLANPATHLVWRGEDTTEQHLTITTGSVEEIDYVAVARHNFGSAAIPVSIEGYISAAWVEIVQDVVLPDDGPVLFRFEPQVLEKVRIRLQSGDAAPTAAVVYVGALLVLQRRIYVGHTPIVDGMVTDVVNGRSVSGNHLGTIVRSRHVATAVAISNLTPAWYRANMRPFIQARVPFFFAWRPSSYPLEIGYGWFPNGHNPRPSNQRSNGMMQVSFQLEGVT